MAARGGNFKGSSGICRYYNSPQGCWNGENCKFQHEEQKPCRFYGSLTGCRYGDNCRYSHASPDAPPSNRHAAKSSKPNSFPETIGIALEVGGSEAKRRSDGRNGEGRSDMFKDSEELYDEYFDEEEDEEDDMMGGYNHPNAMCGFTGKEVMNLISHGVKPYDDDADEFLEFLKENDMLFEI